jgi:hypothetical protein
MAPDARFVDVTYRGLRVATRARLTESAPGTGFVEVEAPLPVGTSIHLGGDTTGAARVTGVVEQEAGAKSPPGMRIVWGEALAPKPLPAPAAPLPAESASASASESLSAAESESDSDSAAESVTASATDSTPPGEPGRGRRRRKKPGRSS